MLPDNLGKIQSEVLDATKDEGMTFVAIDNDCCLSKGHVPVDGIMRDIKDGMGQENIIDENFIGALEELKKQTEANGGQFRVGFNTSANLINAFNADNIDTVKNGNHAFYDRLVALNGDDGICQFSCNDDANINANKLVKQTQKIFNKYDANQAYIHPTNINDDAIVKKYCNNTYKDTNGNFNDTEKKQLLNILDRTYDPKINKIIMQIVRQRALGEKGQIKVIVLDNDVGQLNAIEDASQKTPYKELLVKLGAKIVALAPVRSVANQYKQNTKGTVLASSFNFAIQNKETDFSQVRVLSNDHKSRNNTKEYDAVKKCKAGKKIKRHTVDEIIAMQNISKPITDKAADGRNSMEQLISNPEKKVINSDYIWIDSNEYHQDWWMVPCVSSSHSQLSFNKNDKASYAELLQKRGDDYIKLFEKYTQELKWIATQKPPKIQNTHRFFKFVQFANHLPKSFIHANYGVFNDFILAANKYKSLVASNNYYKADLAEMNSKLIEMQKQGKLFSAEEIIEMQTYPWMKYKSEDYVLGATSIESLITDPNCSIDNISFETGVTIFPGPVLKNNAVFDESLSYDNRRDKKFYEDIIKAQGAKYTQLFTKYANELVNLQKADVNQIPLLRSIYFLDSMPPEFIKQNYVLINRFIELAEQKYIGIPKDKFYTKDGIPKDKFYTKERCEGIFNSLKSKLKKIKIESEAVPEVPKRRIITPPTVKPSAIHRRIVDYLEEEDEDEENEDEENKKQYKHQKQTAKHQASGGSVGSGLYKKQTSTLYDSAAARVEEKYGNSEERAVEREKVLHLKNINQDIEHIANAGLLTRIGWWFGSLFGSEKCQAKLNIVSEFKGRLITSFDDSRYNKCIGYLRIAIGINYKIPAHSIAESKEKKDVSTNAEIKLDSKQHQNELMQSSRREKSVENSYLPSTL